MTDAHLRTMMRETYPYSWQYIINLRANLKTLKIHDLRDFPQAIPQLAQWHYQQWASLYPGQAQSNFEQELRESLTGLSIPRTWVLCESEGESERVFGSASIIADDMETHPELTPWLASVYIDSSLRGQGWGTKLISQLMDDCAAAGLGQVYLFTPGQEQFYASLGWTLRKREMYQGEAVAIMTYDFSRHQRQLVTSREADPC